jgi:signal transduction histidine kinase
MQLMTQTERPQKGQAIRPVRVMICEDEPVFQAALADLLDGDSSLELVGSARNADEAIEIATKERPDVALVDVRMPGGGGHRATREICARSPETKVLALSAVDNREAVFGMLRAGAIGYLLKGLSPEALVGAVTQAASGQAILSRAVTADVIEELVVLLNRSEDFNRELEALDRTKNELIQILSHELRTPVTVIHGAVRTLTKLGIKLSEDQVAAISASVTKSVSKLSRLADNVSAAVGLGGQSVDIDTRPLDVRELLLNAAVEFSNLEDSLRFPTDLEDSVMISANLRLATRALVLVIENALELSPSDHPVEVEIKTDSDHVEISVSDRGPGVPEGQEERVFEPFVQLDSSTTRTHPGLGIGLYLARRIMTAHGGQIELCSRTGGGSNFVLRFRAEGSVL